MNINFFAPLFWITETGHSLINNLLLEIDGVIYNFIRYIYRIFVDLSKVNFFGTDAYAEIIKRFYVVLGLIMLFVLAYSLLKAVINPDNFAKGEASFPKLIQNVVVSLVIIAILPTVFGLAFNVQNALLNKGTLTNIIMGNNTSSDENSNDNYTYEEGYNLFAFETFKGFLYPSKCEATTAEEEAECREQVTSNVLLNIPLLKGKNNLKDIDEEVKNGGSFRHYTAFTQAMVGEDPTLEYSWPISTIAGLFILYVLVNFCFDIALRSVKLAFYQIIAPIPVICRVIPGGKLKDVFSKWVKQIISLFLEVFVRIGAIAFGVKMLDLILNSDQFIALRKSLGFSLTSAFIIMAVVMFIKQIPKVLGDLFGLDTGGMKLGLREKLAAGGGLMAAAALGTGVGLMAKKVGSTIQNAKNAKGLGGKAKAIGAGIATGGISMATGMLRGGYRARGAKNFTDMRKASSGAVDANIKTGEKIKGVVDKYTVDANKKLPGPLGAIQNAANVGFGVAGGVLKGVGTYMGLEASYDALNKERVLNNSFDKSFKEIEDKRDKVLSRDELQSSSALVQAAGGPNMSLSAMKEYLSDIKSTKFNDLKSKTITRADGSASEVKVVTDFNGNEVLINNEMEYAAFRSEMGMQMTNTEKDVGKYIIKYACQNNGLAKMQADINKVALEKQISMQTDNLLNNMDVNKSTSVLKEAGSACVGSLDYMNKKLGLLSFDAVQGKTIKDFNGNDVSIKDEETYNQYKNILMAQYKDAQEKVTSYLNKQIASGSLGNVESIMHNDGFVNFDANTLSKSINEVNNQILENAKIELGGGASSDWKWVKSSFNTFEDMVKDNPGFVRSTYEKQNVTETPPTDFSGENAFERADDMIKVFRDRNQAMDTEYQKLQRANKNDGKDSK